MGINQLDSTQSGPSKRRGLSLGVRIFALPLAILLFLIGITYFSLHRLGLVKSEIDHIAAYWLPAIELASEINEQALLQRVHYERVLRFYEYRPLPNGQIRRELQTRAKLGARIDSLFVRAGHLAKAGDAERGLVDSALARVEQVYGDFNVRADETVRLLEAGETDAAQALEKALDRDEVRFEQTIEGVQQVFDRSFQQAVDTIEKHESQVLHLNLVITLVGVVFGVVFAALLTARLTAPVRRLIDTICLVERGDLDVRLEPTTDDEIGQLTKSFNEMVGELKLKDTIEQTFGKYVDARIVQHLLDESGGPPTGGEKQVMTVLFGDVEGYGDAVQMLSPEALVELTNQYLTQVSALIARCGGIIDKYIGTMVMAFWGRPFTDEEEHAHLACAAALEQVAQLDSLQRLVAVGVGLEAVDLDLRIGLATGPLVAGNMGSEQAKSYTVMGDTANIAFRLKGANKAYGTRILIGESLQPVSRCGGGRRFTFNICGQLCLVQRCKSDRGRHSFVLGGRLTCGPNVFLDCSATRPFSSSEPHSSLVVGSLYDNVKAPIALRFAKSNPVRWMGIFNYLWNCEGGFLCQKPPVGQNYAFGQIGIHALVYNTGLQDHKYENGHIESWDEHVEPQRLYLAQLKKRLGEEAVSNIG